MDMKHVWIYCNMDFQIAAPHLFCKMIDAKTGEPSSACNKTPSIENMDIVKPPKGGHWLTLVSQNAIL